MRLNIRRTCLEIVPEGIQDEVYIEEVLGLRKRSDYVSATRIPPSGLEHALGWVEVKRVTGVGNHQEEVLECPA